MSKSAFSSPSVNVPFTVSANLYSPSKPVEKMRLSVTPSPSVTAFAIVVDCSWEAPTLTVRAEPAAISMVPLPVMPPSSDSVPSTTLIVPSL